MWASDTILDKDSTALAGQGRFLHTHRAIFKDSCPAFCLEEMHLYLTPPQLLSASLKILGRQLLSIEECRQYKAPAVTESSLKCKVFQLAKAIFQKGIFQDWLWNGVVNFYFQAQQFPPRENVPIPLSCMTMTFSSTAGSHQILWPTSKNFN